MCKRKVTFDSVEEHWRSGKKSYEANNERICSFISNCASVRMRFSKLNVIFIYLSKEVLTGYQVESFFYCF